MTKDTTKSIAARTFTTLMIAALGLGALGCGQDTIQVGVVMPLTGEYQTYGEANRRGVELAFEQITSNGYPLVLTLAVEDSGSDPEQAKQLLDQLFDAGAFVALGGSVSDEALAMVEVADKYNRILLSPSATNPRLTGTSKNFYRIAPSDLTEGNKMADFAFRTLELGTVAVVAEGQSFARGIQEAFTTAFKKQGGEVLEQIDVPPNTDDFAGLMERVVTLEPDAVYLAAYEAGVAAMILELRRLDFKGRILTTHAFSSPAAIARVGRGAAGVVLTQSVFEPDSEHAHVQKFVNAYRERYGEEPDLFAAEGYDAMNVLALALEDRHTLPTDLQRGLHDAIKEFPGVTGAIQFDESNDVRKFPRVYIIGSDLSLYDYSKRIEENQKKLRDKQEEIKRRIDEIRRNAAGVGNGS
ncbi:MAG: amino acid ABC transporter substrate-binding protein [bacterium]|nr:amino acid ABC transporter substrate-binding protein [bacterium]